MGLACSSLSYWQSLLCRNIFCSARWKENSNFEVLRHSVYSLQINACSSTRSIRYNNPISRYQIITNDRCSILCRKYGTSWVRRLSNSSTRADSPRRTSSDHSSLEVSPRQTGGEPASAKSDMGARRSKMLGLPLHDGLAGLPQFSPAPATRSPLALSSPVEGVRPDAVLSEDASFPSLSAMQDELIRAVGAVCEIQGGWRKRAVKRTLAGAEVRVARAPVSLGHAGRADTYD